MISPFDMCFASTPVIAMKSTGCLRFPECPRAGGVGRMIFFKGQKAVLWRRANRDVANHDFSRAKFCVAFHMCGSAGNSPRARLLIGNFRPSTLYRRYGNAASSPPQPSETKAHVEIGGICSDRRRARA